MSEATLPVSDTKSLLVLFGTRDQHLRRVREALGVTVSNRSDRIHIEGEEAAVAKATEVFEQLQAIIKRQGTLTPDEVSEALARVTGEGPFQHAARRHAARRPADPSANRGPGPEGVETIGRHDLVFCTGPAGTGKTYLAVAMAVQALKHQQIRKIVLVRPAVEAGESLGFLPGDLQAKINPLSPSAARPHRKCAR